jgi:hypothetical protein
MTEQQPLELNQKNTKEGKTIWVATRKEEPPITPLSREAFRRQLTAQKDYCVEQISIFKDKIRDIEAMICRVDELEAQGMIVRYREEGSNLAYETQEKPPLGFPHPQPSKSGSTKDSSVWKREQEERGKRK